MQKRGKNGVKNRKNFCEFLRYSSLSMLGMLGLSCYILADTFFISKGLGAKGITALNLAIPIYSFIHGCGLMIGMGGAAKYSVAKSRNENSLADRIFTCSVVLALIFAAVFVFTGVFFSETITKILGADGEVFEMTVIYLKVILLFSPAFIINNLLICFIRNDANPKLSMTAMVTGSLSNIVLDYIFIFPLRMGIFGAVFATGLSPVISMAVLAVHKIQGKNKFHLTKNEPFFGMPKDILSLGFPSLVTEVSSGVVIMIFNIIILRLRGNTGVAAYGIIANLSLVVISVYTGLAQGVQPLMSRAHGMGDSHNMKIFLKYALAAMSCISAAVYLLIFFKADMIAKVFNNEGSILLQETAVRGLKIYFTAVLSAGFNIIVSVYFTSAEKAAPAHIISLMRGFAVIVPMAFILSELFGIDGVWLSFPVTECIVAAAGAVFYAVYKK
jgi:putative MATE family efflux protein